MKFAPQPKFVDFYLPFGGKLDPKNRWVKLASFVPWESVEIYYTDAPLPTQRWARRRSLDASHTVPSS